MCNEHVGYLWKDKKVSYISFLMNIDDADKKFWMKMILVSETTLCPDELAINLRQKYIFFKTVNFKIAYLSCTPFKKKITKP
jgi:hypothetical protein